MRRKVFLFTFLAITCSLSAQRFNGFIHSDFSGILGARVQPASIAGSPYKWDLSLVNADVFITNNIARLEASEQSTSIKRFIDNKVKFLQGGGSVGGFSLLLTLPRKQAIGLSYQLRAHASGNNISPRFISQVNRFTDTRFVNSTVENESGEFAAGLWRELSFTYAKVVYDDGANLFKAGITAKMVNTYGSAYAHMIDVDYSINSNGLGLFNNVQMKFGYSLNLDPFEGFNGTDRLNGLPPKNKYSAAFDLGVVYEQRGGRPNKKTEKGTRIEPDVDYDFRLSASITDLGILEFSHGDASTEILGLLPNINPMLNLDLLLSGVDGFDTLADSVASFAQTQGLGGRYKLSMPTALNLNYDYNMGNDWYFNANAVVDLTGLMPVDYRLNYLHNITLTARWEQSRRGMYFPLHINQIGDVHLGAAARLGILTLGTQNLGAIFSSNRTSFGFFFTLNLNKLVANSKKPYCFGSSRGSGMTRTKRTPLYKRKKFLFF